MPFCPAHCRCYCFSHVCLFEQINDDNDDIDDDDELACGDGMSWLDLEAMGEDGIDKDRVGKCSDHIVAQQANQYIVAFHIAISLYRTIRSGLLITGGL